MLINDGFVCEMLVRMIQAHILCVFTFGIHILKRVNGLKLGKFHQLEKTKKQHSSTQYGGAMFLTSVLFVFIQKRFLETAKDGTYAG